MRVENDQEVVPRTKKYKGEKVQWTEKKFSFIPTGMERDCGWQVFCRVGIMRDLKQCSCSGITRFEEPKYNSGSMGYPGKRVWTSNGAN